MANKWQDKNVKVHWIERGENFDCEKELNFVIIDSPVIAFREEWDSFEEMRKPFNIENMNNFIK